MLRAFRAFLEFCYIARKNLLDTNDLVQLKDALDRFHQYRQIFITVGVRENFNLPRQHSMVHFLQLVRAFGAPNGLCSSITESKHIKAVKEPWRRSSRYKATIQMLTTNTRLDKLAAMRTDFVRRGMLPSTSKPRSASNFSIQVFLCLSLTLSYQLLQLQSATPNLQVCQSNQRTMTPWPKSKTMTKCLARTVWQA